MNAARPVVFGEILFDRFASGREVLGGAPLNVAAHLAGLGESPLLVSRVGGDPAAERALDELERRGVLTAAIQRDEARPTGRVDVGGTAAEPNFEIAVDQAWDAIDPAGAAAAVVDHGGAGWLYHGTLAARCARSREALAAVRAAVGAAVFVDVNLRPPWTPPRRALELARGADWLKASREELAELFAELATRPTGQARDDAAGAVRAATAAARLVVTAGARGAALHGAAQPSPIVVAAADAAAPFVDAVGAGDGFAAVLLLGALRRWPEPLALSRAADFAAAICGVQGALPPDLDFYRGFRRQWELDR